MRCCNAENVVTVTVVNLMRNRLFISLQLNVWPTTETNYFEKLVNTSESNICISRCRCYPLNVLKFWKNFDKLLNGFHYSQNNNSVLLNASHRFVAKMKVSFVSFKFNHPRFSFSLSFRQGADDPRNIIRPDKYLAIVRTKITSRDFITHTLT